MHSPKSSCHTLLPAFERQEATTQMIASIVMYSTSEREILSYERFFFLPAEVIHYAKRWKLTAAVYHIEIPSI